MGTTIVFVGHKSQFKRMANPQLRILVTGGAGFIGSHLCRRLVNDGHDVICLDSYVSGLKSHVTDLSDRQNFEIVRQDVTDRISVEVDQIYHLACPASPVSYQANAIKTLKTNVLGTLNALGLAKRTGARILLASTSEIYGDPLEHPQRETYFGNVNPVGIRSCYDEGKRAAEAMCMDYKRQHDTNVCIARIFNTYGPSMMFNDGRVISNFIVAGISGQPLEVYGTGSQTRSFCYIDDLIEGLVKLMNSNEIGPINLGNPREMTVLQAAQLTQSLLGNSTDIKFKELPADDPCRRQPDITKAKELLGWEPKVSFEEGLEKTVADFKQRASASPHLLTVKKPSC